MHERARELIDDLRLQPLPEGGRFAEVHRSARRVRAHGEGQDRAAVTTIYFLLTAGDASRWHRLDADEVWHFYEGSPLELFLLDAPARILTRARLGPLSPGAAPVHVVPAGSWLAARPDGEFALVGCTMGPGFDAAGFTLMKDVPALAANVARRFPEVARFL
jgi:predicted cupin superfamily sugar epimerase